MINADELLNMMADVPAEKKPDFDSNLEAACWFVAVKAAEAFLDGITVRDIAHMIVNGNPIDGPIHTKVDIDEWLHNRFDGLDQDEIEAHSRALSEDFWEFWKR